MERTGRIATLARAALRNVAPSGAGSSQHIKGTARLNIKAMDHHGTATQTAIKTAQPKL